jgi:hypothetical protein
MKTGDPFDRHFARCAAFETRVGTARNRLDDVCVATIKAALEKLPCAFYRGSFLEFETALLQHFEEDSAIAKWMHSIPDPQRPEQLAERARLIDDEARRICLGTEMARLQVQDEDVGELWSYVPERATRKPLAAAATDLAANAFRDITGKPPTRVSKKVSERNGLQETGKFAEFLKDIFAALGITASAAAQVKLWQARQIP